MQAVSVIATVLNEAGEIGRLVSSLLEQNPPAREVIVVDGGSTDGTWEWLEEAAHRNPTLRPIRDESCSLKNSPGPIARGRNVAIAAATSPLIACTDAGCAYAPEWLSRLTAPLAEGKAEYSLGGSCLDLADATVWDLASAPFFGVRLDPLEPNKSCTARSMAFTRDLWLRIGGFPESVFFGEDTLFDLKARSLAQPAFVENAKAIYRPQYGLRSACRQLASYAASDGILGVRRTRLFRNAARCLIQIAALLVIPLTVLPLIAILALQLHFAFHPDWRQLRRKGVRALAARLLFSVLVPWMIVIGHLRGWLTRKDLPNRQNRSN